MIETIRLAGKNLLRRKKRTAIVVFSVMLSASLLISSLAIGTGLVSTVRNRVEETNIDIIITTDGLHSIPNGHGMAKELEKLEGVDFASPILTAFDRPVAVRGHGGGFTFSPFPIGVIPKNLQRALPESNVQQIEGWFSQEDDPHYDNGTYDGPWTYEIGIDRILANELGVDIGDPVDVLVKGTWIQFNVTLIITLNFGGEVGTGLFLSFFHLSELQSIVGLDKRQDTGAIIDAVDTVSVVVLPEYRGDRQLFFQLLAEIQELYPNYEVNTKEQLINEMSVQTAMAEAFALAIGSIAFMIGLLFVVASMVITVDERRGEIGMLRAIGFSSKTVFSLFFTESVILVLLGTLGGIGAGYLFNGYLGSYMERTFGITLETGVFQNEVLGQYFMLVLMMGSLASLYPAAKACRASVINALREV
ncbi:MAG: FtsX-like permease family protein [Candidatus Thermoplasmatota archaeon]|nr:FtsX-like permease family protein [Candidatus Thermoplasmatota archaeon]